MIEAAGVFVLLTGSLMCAAAFGAASEGRHDEAVLFKVAASGLVVSGFLLIGLGSLLR